MRLIERLRELDRPYYTVADIVEISGLARSSVKRQLIRKVQSGDLIRVRRDLYLLTERYSRYGRIDHFRLANLIQTPSYVSYLSALAYYEMTTQIPVAFVESANPVRSRSFEVADWTYRYYYCRRPYYSDYVKAQGSFIATPEKALIDSLYLMSLGRYELDQAALDLRSIRWKTLQSILSPYPSRFKNYVVGWRNNNE